MGAEIVIWFIYGALFTFLFLLSVIHYQSSPKVYCQLALFSLLFSASSILTAVGRILPIELTTDDGYRSWLYDSPPPMQLAFPCLSIILYKAIFDAQLQFFKFYAVVLSNYGRWSTLHMNPRISKLSSTMDLYSGDTTHLTPLSIWRWFNILLLVIYGVTVIALVCCQFVLNDPVQLNNLSLSKAICASVLSLIVLLNLISSMHTRHKMNLRYCLTRHPPKEEKAGFEYATSSASSALVPEDKSKRSLLILILSPIFFLSSSLAITFELWITYGALTRSTTAEISSSLMTALSPSLASAITIINLVVECLFVCVPITLLVVLHVFYVKPYPLTVAPHNIEFLP